ncbi:aromatic compound dioxygenase [Marasmius fiardii PR-910]|nr:aromatic compound dioxygenase [Marasmius fiardii PR-910]
MKFTTRSAPAAALILLFSFASAAPRDLTKRSIYANIQNTTCVLSPEVTRSNFIQNAPVRQDITEGQVGVPLTLDIGVLDVTTCQPLKNVMVEVWGANAHGDFGDTFLRGAFQTDSAGIVEFQTIFPGFSSDGANHLNVAIHQNNMMSSPTAHSGRFFFTDRWTDVISMSDDYKGNTHKRVLNGEDSSFNDANKNGFNAIVDIQPIQDDWPSGVVGYITVGINPSQSNSA